MCCVDFQSHSKVLGRAVCLSLKKKYGEATLYTTDKLPIDLSSV